MEPIWKKARTQQRSRSQEVRFASGAGAGKQLNSGRHWFSKRDTRKFEFLVENRLVVKAEQYIIKGAELPKLTRDAFFHRKLPAMNIEFDNGSLHEDWILIRTVDFDDMHQRIFELEALLQKRQDENETEETYRDTDSS